MFAAAQPVQAITVDIFGQIDAFNTIANPLIDSFGDTLDPGQDWTGFGGLLAGNIVQMTVTYDETDVTGAAIETVAFSSMNISFLDAAGTAALLSYSPDSTADDDLNFLYFENGSLTDFDRYSTPGPGSAEDTADYYMFGGDGYFYLEDFDSEDTVLQGSWNILPPTTVVPVPAAVWLFGSGLLGLVGIARRKA
jgi:hypothetical protein